MLNDLLFRLYLIFIYFSNALIIGIFIIIAICLIILSILYLFSYIKNKNEG